MELIEVVVISTAKILKRNLTGPSNAFIPLERAGTKSAKLIQRSLGMCHLRPGSTTSYLYEQMC
jgi:hypothetical protein